MTDTLRTSLQQMIEGLVLFFGLSTTHAQAALITGIPAREGGGERTFREILFYETQLQTKRNVLIDAEHDVGSFVLQHFELGENKQIMLYFDSRQGEVQFLFETYKIQTQTLFYQRRKHHPPTWVHRETLQPVNFYNPFDTPLHLFGRK